VFVTEYQLAYSKIFDFIFLSGRDLGASNFFMTVRAGVFCCAMWMVPYFIRGKERGSKKWIYIVQIFLAYF